MKLTIVTERMKETRGDLTAAYNLIEELKKIRPDLEIHWAVVDPAGRNIPEEFVAENTKCHIIPSYGSIKTISSAVQDSDLFLTFPTLADKDDLEHITQFSTPILQCLEYDYNDHTKGKTVINGIEIMKWTTGLDENSLGIFIKPLAEPSFSKSEPEMEKTFLKEQIELKKEEVHSEAELYFKQNQLFIGYFNRDQFAEQNNDIVSPALYSYLCISKSLRDNPGKNIDLVINMNADQYDQLSKILKDPTHPLYRKEFESIGLHPYNATDKQHFINGKINVRVLNRFPYPQPVFQELIKISDPFIALTGDQSFSEGISQNKLMMYQLMGWKEKFFISFLKYIANVVGKESELFQFYRLQYFSSHFFENVTKEEFIERIKKIDKMLDENKEKLLQQQDEVRKSMLNDKNLFKILPGKLVELMENLPAKVSRQEAIENLKQLVSQYDNKEDKDQSIARSYMNKAAILSNDLLLEIIEILAQKRDVSFCEMAINNGHSSALFPWFERYLIANKENMANMAEDETLNEQIYYLITHRHFTSIKNLYDQFENLQNPIREILLKFLQIGFRPTVFIPLKQIQNLLNIKPDFFEQILLNLPSRNSVINSYFAMLTTTFPTLNVDVRNNDGNSPLILIIQSLKNIRQTIIDDRKELCISLIKHHGTNLLRPNKDGKSALDIVNDELNQFDTRKSSNQAYRALEEIKTLIETLALKNSASTPSITTQSILSHSSSSAQKVNLDNDNDQPRDKKKV